MSVTLVVIPASLGSQVVLGLITSLIASATVSGALSTQRYNELEAKQHQKQDNYTSAYSLDNLIAGEMNKEFQKPYATICSQYKTVFKDEDLLIKTLEEHGVENIQSEDGKIYCSLEALKFEFEKNSEDVYVMNITHKENEDLDIVNELGEEYQSNVQEQSYMNIKKNLENQNMQIDSEEVLEDNSIMITVNLE